MIDRIPSLHDVAEAEGDAQHDDADDRAAEMLFEPAQQEGALQFLADAAREDRDDAEHGGSARPSPPCCSSGFVGTLCSQGASAISTFSSTHDQEEHHRNEERADAGLPAEWPRPEPEFRHPLTPRDASG